MTFDELRTPWQETNCGSTSLEKREELVVRVCRRVERTGASIVRRDVIETLAAVFVILCFGGMFLTIDGVVAKIGAATVVLGAFYIVYRLYQARMDRKLSRLDDSVRDFYKTEIERLNRQIDLLRSVLWWYISPLMVGANLIFFGVNGIGIGSIGYLIFTLFFGWGIYWLNQNAVVKTLVPLRNELEGLLKELGETV